MKLPVVASNVQPYKETITHGVDGYLFQGEDNLVDILSQLIYNPKLRDSIGQYAYQK